MLKVVEITFTCDAEFDVVAETIHALGSHMVQIYKKAAMVQGYSVAELTEADIEERALANLATSMDQLTEALNRLRIEGRLT